MKKATLRIISYVNLPKTICEHMFGDDHGHVHRMVVGGCVMIVGVVIAKEGVLLIHSPVWHILADVVGYSVHGFGLTPYIEWALSHIGNKPSEPIIFPELDPDLFKQQETEQ